MFRSRRSFAWSLIFVLLCASIAVAQKPPVTRAAANTYYVDNALDGSLSSNPSACPNNENDANNKNCSFRQAIQRANADTGTSEIRFIIPADSADPDNGYDAGTQSWVIKPNSPLPALTSGNTTITGRNDNPAGTPRIVLDGTNVPTTNAVGITLSSASNVVTQLIIINFNGTSGTSGIGIRINLAAATGNQVYGNYIGNRPNDATAYPNRRAGIQIDSSAASNIIGLGDAPGQRNVISGNGTSGTGDGIVLQGVANNLIQGNYIGLGLGPGLNPVQLANAGYGVQIADGSGNTVGGAAATMRNVISGNGLTGVLLTGTGSSGNQVTGNYIGTDVFGTADLGNGQDGVQIVGGAKNNVVSSSLASRAVISGNAGYGVLISDLGTTGNQISSVFIGVSVGGGLNLPNDAGGVRIQNDTTSNTVGGASAGNVISGNIGYGVSLGRTTPGFTDIFSNTVSGNYIGLNSAGTQTVANTLGGVLIDTGSHDNRIGGATVAERNVISGNGGPGVTISGTLTFSSTVTGNVIGLRSSSVGGPFTTAGGNTGDGVLITNGAQFTRVGGTAAEANTIAANTGNGVHVSGATTNKLTTIQSNYIGVAFNNNAYVPVGNGANGVLVDTGAQRVKILDNHISRNTSKGIALTPQTVGPPGSASNPNHDIDAPFNVHLNQTGRLTGRVYADGSNAACGATCTIQIFTADPAALDRQGRDKVTPASLQISANGYFTATLSSQLPAQLALTATDAAGNTSEFTALTGTLKLAIGPARSSSAIPGQVITYTHRITNSGEIDFTNLRLSATSSRNWPFSLTPTPTTDISLAARESKTVTLTLSLPSGSDPRVRTGGQPDFTRVTIKSTSIPTATASVTDTTTVLGKFILDASFKPGRKGTGTPGSLIDYTRTMTNTGNVTGTVTLAAITDLGPTWTTIITPTSVQLPPGKAIGVTTSVKIPTGATAGTVGKTALTFNGTPDAQHLVITDTTTVLLTPKATMVFNQQAQGNAGKTVQFCHTVTNLSNGPATFTLTGVSSLGSKITFVSDTPGRPLVNGNTFTVGISDTDKSFNFCANVVIDPFAVRGQQDLIAIGLLDSQGAVVGGASVRDLIDVVGGQILPRLRMPIMLR